MTSDIRRNGSWLDRRSFLRSGGRAVAGGVLLAQGYGPLFAQDAQASSATKVVDTAAGKMRGMMIGKVNAFKGIPYGASTAGAARFMPPAKPISWSGVLDAVALGQRAPQGGQDIMFISFPELERKEPEGEDCLRLNVWTNAVGAGTRPVMVWLHGGGYATGSGGFIAYDGANLARKEDVVVVTVNHRLNVFGFLDVAAIGGEKYAHSANLGMQDIVAALQWVHDNIAQFGGDASNVTIFGQSGGGGKVSTLLAMPAAKGLFRQAIVESGSTSHQTPNEDAAKIVQEFLRRMNVNSVDELQQVPMQQIRAQVVAAAGRAFAAPAAGARPPTVAPLTFGPVVDGSWLPKQPSDPESLAVSANIPLLTGSNATELTFFPGTPMDEIDESTLQAQVKTMLRTDDASANNVIAAYRKSRPNATSLDIEQILAADLAFRKNMHQQVDLKVAEGKAPVYVYYFDWRTPVAGGKFKACHCLEIPFVFQNLEALAPMVGSGPELQALGDQISGAWAAFARNGNPNHRGLPHWSAQQPTQRLTMVLDEHPKVVDDPDREERIAVAAVAKVPPTA